MALHRPSCRLMDLDAELIVDFLTHIETVALVRSCERTRALQTIVTVELQLGVRAAGSAS